LKYQTGEIGQADERISTNFDQARDYLTAARNKGTNYLTDQNAIARGDINGAQTAGQNYLTGGAAQAAGIYDQALSPWQQLSGMGTQGVQDHYNLISNPDSIYDSELYKSREQATIDGLNREANSRGMLSSGNNSQDIMDYMRQGGLDYFNTLANQYQPYFGMAQNAAQGQANVLGQKAGMYDQLGQNQAGLSQWGGGQLSGIANSLGQNQAGLAQWAGGLNAANANQLGSNLANLRTGTANQLADNREQEGQLLSGNRLTAGQAGSDMYTNQANAQSAADSNMWGALLGLGSGITGGLGSYVGAGGRF
jgi:hypothetical protein